MYKIKLSPYANIFCTEWQLNPDSSVYNIVMDQMLYGVLDLERLREALKKYVLEQVLLNSHIQEIGGEPHWVRNDSIYELEYVDGPVSKSELLAFVRKKFELYSGPLYRFKLIRIDEGIHRFIVVLHHILLDALSLNEGVFTAIANYYNNPSHAAKYGIEEQVSLISNLTLTLSSRVIQSQNKYENFWYQYLPEVEGVDLTFFKLESSPNLSHTDNLMAQLDFSYGAVELSKLNQIKECVVTPYIYSLCIFALLLHRYTNQKKFAIAYPVAIRDGVDFIYGAQVNTSLIVYEFSQIKTITDLFKKTLVFFRSLRQDGVSYNHYPITNIISGDNRDLLNIWFTQANMRNRVFNFDGTTKAEVSTELHVDTVNENVPLFEQELVEGNLYFRVRFNKKIINEELLKSFITSYKKLFLEVLEDLVSGNDRLISDYSILDKRQYQQIVYEFTQTEKDYPCDKTIHEFFEKQALETPNNIAVMFEDVKLTYRELNYKANQLAHYLLSSYKIKPDDLVAICLDRSEQMVVAILGVLKSGGAYVPIDPSLPDKRIGYILNDAKARVILTSTDYQKRLQQIYQARGKRLVVAMDSTSVQAKLEQQKQLDPKVFMIGSNLIYVLYTSGTTGEPKGVMLEHGSCVNRILEMISTGQMLGNEKVLFKTNFMFDVSFSDIFTALFTGASLIVAKNVFDIDEIAARIVNYSVNVCHFTSSQFETILGIKGVELFNNFKILNFSGEALYPRLLSNINTNVLCANYYGPTEAGEVTFEATKLTKMNANVSIIGKALHNIKLYILDKYLQPLPIGAVGELYIGGICLARGYLNNLQLTAARFIVNPLQTDREKSQRVNNRLYKTGDLVRWLPDGNIEYLGRNDFQVKIRGNRIELGEIENKLIKFEGVKQAIAVVNENTNDDKHEVGTKYLVVYYLADRKLDEVKMGQYLQECLPGYMLPSTIIYLDKLPLTTSGKLDKSSLPQVDFTDSYIAPTSRLQSQVAAIWSKILRLSKSNIGITDNFFQLGGTSLLVIRLQHELAKMPKFNNIKIADLFRFPTIEQLTEFVSNENEEDKVVKDEDVSWQIESNNDIAIIAMSGAFSGCKNVTEYWDLINLGNEGLSTATMDECRQYGISDEILQNPNFIARSGHVADTDKFDPEFWGLTPNEAKNMDPQVRKFLEHCCCVLETSGYISLTNKISIGVFAGGGDSVYVTHFARQPLIVSGIGNLSIKDALATRVAYLLGLTGPANNINTACSTSLVTVIEACKSLSGKYCDMAIAGGSALLLPEEIGYIHQEGMIFSQDGHCRTFDYRASGTVHGSGVGVVLLKRLADAEKDGDNIIAVIKGYATNNDGARKVSYAAPSVVGQKECIITARKMAKISSDRIGYVECHGTGTKLGDPIEIQALSEAFKYGIDKNSGQSNKCVIGAVKANIGHTGAAAGIASLIKVCQMLRYKIIPKQINYEAPNPELHLDETNFEIANKARKWDKVDDMPRIAGVSSFGIGGTNAHVIVSEYIPAAEKKICEFVKKSDVNNYILPLSANSQLSLEAYRRSFVEHLSKTKSNIKNIAYTLQLRRKHFDYRLSVVCGSNKEAIDKLESSVVGNKINRQERHNIVFMFSGQGSQYANMGLDLYQHDDDYKKIVDECIRLVSKCTNIQFEKVLFPALFADDKTGDYDINQAQWAQPALFVIEYSLAKLLGILNISAASYIGHSIGEYVAATLAGIFSLEEAIKIIVIRGQLMQSMPKGAMLSIQANAIKVDKIIKDNNCELAVINSPKNCVVSGSVEAIANLKTALDKLEIAAIVLRVSHAYHSGSMEDASKKFMIELQKIKLKKPQKRFISNLTGNFITPYEAVSPEYWVNHLRHTVLFSEGIKTIFNTYSNLFFVEVGAGKSLMSFVKQHNVEKYNAAQLLNSRKEYENDLSDICSKEDVLSRLWSSGYNADFNGYYGYEGNGVVDLPNYCFDQHICWVNQVYDRNAVMVKDNLPVAISDSGDLKNRVVEKNLSDKYYGIAKIYLDVSGVNKISIDDTFQTLGIDSLQIVKLLFELQRNYKIGLNVLLDLQTIAKVAEFAPFAKNNLVQRLGKIKLFYAKREREPNKNEFWDPEKCAEYMAAVKQMTVKKGKKNIRCVMLTGAAGYVGCNILYQLLHETEYKIYLPVRAASQKEAVSRLKHKFTYYFDLDLDKYQDRITILASDLEEPGLGLTSSQYQELVAHVDSIIHSAASVKMYGNYDFAYRTNVQATINLLDLAKLTNGKDFHYISTTAVITEGHIPGHKYFVFHEDDDIGILQNHNHTYSLTKREGEVIVNKYREHGVTSNIYRLGTVGMHSGNYRYQENIEDNGFFAIFKTILDLGTAYKELLNVEISQVDCVAKAIVKLFDQAYLGNQTYHVFNPCPYNLGRLFAAKKMSVKLCSVNKFFDTILDVLAKNDMDAKQIELFMLHKRWLQDADMEDTLRVKILQDKTVAILAELGFYWPKITDNMWSGFIKLANARGK